MCREVLKRENTNKEISAEMFRQKREGIEVTEYITKHFISRKLVEG